MTKQNVAEPESLGEAMNRTELFFEKNGRKLTYVFLGLLVLAALVYGYRALIVAPRAEKAAEMIAEAQSRFEAENPDFELALQGDVAVERQDYAKAVDFYRKAVKAADNNLTAPMYLRKAGLAAQAQGDAAAAAGFYQQILDTYPASMEAREAEKLLGSAK